MEILTGSLYFVSNEFFEKIDDPYPKINYENTKRPHYFAFHDDRTGLFWLVPCSSKVEKYEKLIQELENAACVVAIKFSHNLFLYWCFNLPFCWCFPQGFWHYQGSVRKVVNW